MITSIGDMSTIKAEEENDSVALGRLVRKLHKSSNNGRRATYLTCAGIGKALRNALMAHKHAP